MFFEEFFGKVVADGSMDFQQTSRSSVSGFQTGERIVPLQPGEDPAG